MTSTKVKRIPSVVLVGSGQYTIGDVNYGESSDVNHKSDKPAGIVALTFFDLQQRGLIDKITIVGTNGTKMPFIRKHIESSIIEKYNMLNVNYKTLPSDDIKSDVSAYEKAIDELNSGDLVIVTTPDNTHFDIIHYAITHYCNIMSTKPLCHTLSEHFCLIDKCTRYNVLCCIEYHKRFDPMYSDAMTKICNKSCGLMNFFNSYMSQPFTQLNTFSNWFNQSKNNISKAETEIDIEIKNASDISYYLNSHHIDFLCNSIHNQMKIKKVCGLGSYGVANELFNKNNNDEKKSKNNNKIEDTITLMVEFESIENPLQKGHAQFTSSWIAQPSDVHSQQRLHFLGEKNELSIDQAHRGYTSSSSSINKPNSFKQINPLYFRLEPDQYSGKFIGQQTYGYKSFELFVNAATELNEKQHDIKDRHIYEKNRNQIKQDTKYLCHIDSIPAIQTTTILNAGRMSLDNNSKWINIIYDTDNQIEKLEISQ